MVGREVRILAQLLFPVPKVEVDWDSNIHAAQMKDKMEEIYHLARQKLKNSANVNKRSNYTILSQTHFRISSLVYKYNNFFKKFEERWFGLFVITEALSPVLYKIQGRKKSENVHHDRLKSCKSDDVPAWV